LSDQRTLDVFSHAYDVVSLILFKVEFLQLRIHFTETTSNPGVKRRRTLNNHETVTS
jgi:hypothetical protein